MKIRFSGIRKTFEMLFGGKQEVHIKPPVLTNQMVIDYLTEAGFIDAPPTVVGPRAGVSVAYEKIFNEVFGPYELSPELVRLLPDRAQCAYQASQRTGDDLTRWLCVQLAHTRFERDRYKHDFAECSVKLFNAEEERQALMEEQK